MMIILSMLAVWRATYMLQQESGPFGIFRRLQAWFWKDPANEGGIKDGFRCFYCTSVWLSILPAILLANNLSIIILILAISAGAVFIDIIHQLLTKDL